jgi:glycosyltransferase involved in cell wall biosynthesis
MSRPLSFLHLSTFYPPYSFGGDAMYVYRLCRALADAGHHVDVAHCVDSYRLLHPAAPPIPFAEHPGVIRHELRSPFKWLSPLLSQQTGRPLLKGRALRQLLDRRAYDVIHFHNTSLLGPAVLGIRGSAGDPLRIYTTHEHWLICANHVLWKYDGAPCREPDCLRCVLHAKRPPQIWRYTGPLRRSASHVDQFVSPSRFTAAIHAERGFPYPVDYLPYFVDRNDGDWRNPGPRPQEKPYFLFVGRLEIIKGLQTLIRLWNRVPDYDLLVVGTGTADAELRALAAPNPRIRFLGPLPQKELGAIYHHALATLVPSITYETFGVISVESFARKTPVIVRALGALPESVEDSGGGFVYGSDEELLGYMYRIAGDPALRADLGERGYAAFLRLWSRDAHFKLYFDYLDRAAKRKFGRLPWAAEARARQPV